MRNKLVFTTTALSRPEILEQTYASFLNNIDGADISKCTLYINIDPVLSNKLQQDTLLVAKKYFDNVICNLPEQPNFTKAVNWCWSSANTPYIFHIEDDWLLLKKININNILNVLDKNDTAELILRAYTAKYIKLALSPSIWKYDLYKTFAGKLSTDMNPEVQLRNFKFSYAFEPKNIVTEGDGVIVKDIGRGWLNKKGLKKPTKLKFIKY